MRGVMAVLLVMGTIAVQGSAGLAAGSPDAIHGDFDGDGFGDLAVGVPAEDVARRNGTVADAGTVQVLYGSADGVTAAGNQVLSQDTADVSDVPEAGDRFGNAVTWGDFDDDGYDDLAIGADREDLVTRTATIPDAGVVHVLYGSAGGLSGAGSQVWSQSSTDVEDIAEDGDFFGFSLVAGDFNGDEIDDLAIGIAGEDAEGVAEDSGAVEVLLGSGTGLTAAGDIVIPRIFGEFPGDGDLLGFSLAAADMGRGPEEDLAIGIPNRDVSGAPGAGAVVVHYGTPDGLDLLDSQVWHQDASGVLGAAEEDDGFGRSLAAANFGSDGHADLAVGAWLEDLTFRSGTIADAGAVNVIYGTAEGLASGGNQLWSQASADILDSAEEGDGFGSRLVAANFGMGTRSGRADLAITVAFEQVGEAEDTGAVNVIYGYAGGLAADGNQFWSQDSTGVIGVAEDGDGFGSSLAAGNLGKSAHADLAIGVAGEDFGDATNTGVVHVLYAAGAAGGLSADDQLWHQDVTGVLGSNEIGDAFGQSAS